MYIHNNIHNDTTQYAYFFVACSVCMLQQATTINDQKSLRGCQPVQGVP